MLTGFTAGLLLITISELGDKTFFIALILALRHSRHLVFVGVVAALASMTVISVLIGKVATILPAIYLYYLEIILFLIFGLKLLYDALNMPSESDHEEEESAAVTVEKAEAKLPQKKPTLAVLLEAFSLTFVAEWGDRTQIATITLAAAHNSLGVVTGAILGHAFCGAIAVYGGKLIAGKISERTITALGGCLFLLFSAVAWWEGR